LINKKYFVTVSLRGCSAVDSVWVIVNNLPKADAGKDTIVCNSSYLILRATGGISYQWNNGVSGVTNNIHPTSNSTYVVTVTDSNNCTASDDVVISVKNPKPDAGTNISSCNGTVVKLTASGGDRYSWNTGDTTTIINVKPSQNTTYTVTVNSAACSGTANVIVSVVNIHADAGKDTVICKGDILTLTASGGGNYSWSTSDTTSNIKITPLINTKYFLTATLNGCSSMDSISVSVKNLPIAKAGKDTIVCNGSSVTLTATGGKTYSWSNGATGTPVIVIPTSNMAYVVTVYDNNNCFAKDTVFVNVKNSFPSAGSNTVSCNGQIVKLTASGGGKYLWNTGDTTAIISILPLKMTTYSVTVTSGNCSGTSNVVVSVDSIKADAGSDITIVKDSSTTLNVAGGTYFKWSNGDTTSIIKVKPDSTTTYIVTISDNQGCSASDNVVVTVVPGNKTVSEMTVKIYPNPSKGAFKIKTDGITDKIITVIIYDVLGQIVFEDDEFKVYNGAEIEIRTDLGKGAYLLEIITQNDSVVQKLIID
ncbi:MAG: T9SS type A sorting domain-containing protein, partial [Bacteroidota bacterium]|nr:T9SS type A sorting domain-containing protein [Bacteroidota bacterium]